jgi:hypothetical protein
MTKSCFVKFDSVYDLGLVIFHILIRAVHIAPSMRCSPRDQLAPLGGVGVKLNGPLIYA